MHWRLASSSRALLLREQCSSISSRIPRAHRRTRPFKVWANVDYAGALGRDRDGQHLVRGRRSGRAFRRSPRASLLARTNCGRRHVSRPSFAAAGKKAYREWNFAPSGAWAAYDFKAYRKGRTDAEIAAPYVRMEDNLIWWTLGATIAVPAGTEWELGLSAVLEEKDGDKSYWALAHGGDKPDFHAADCFAARLP